MFLCTRGLLVGLIFALASGYAYSADTITIDNPNNSLVFGYIDMSDAPTKVQGATLMQIAPATDSP